MTTGNLEKNYIIFTTRHSELGCIDVTVDPPFIQVLNEDKNNESSKMEDNLNDLVMDSIFEEGITGMDIIQINDHPYILVAY